MLSPKVGFASVVVHTLSQGVLFAQVNNYFFGPSLTDKTRANAGDSKWLKGIAWAVLVLTICQTLQQLVKVWQVLSFALVDFPGFLRWTEFFFNGTICVIVQGFFVIRCWKVTDRSYITLVPLTTLTVTTYAATLYFCVILGHGPAMTLSEDVTEETVPFMLWILGSTSLDIMIAIILLIYLFRSRTGFRHLDAVVSKILLITWECAVPPVISMLVAVALFHAQFDIDDDLQSQIVILFLTITGKLYAHSFFRTLNYRAEFRVRVKSRPSEMGRRETLSAWDVTGEPGSTPISPTIAAFSTRNKWGSHETVETLAPSVYFGRVGSFASRKQSTSKIALDPVADDLERGTWRRKSKHNIRPSVESFPLHPILSMDSQTFPTLAECRSNLFDQLPFQDQLNTPYQKHALDPGPFSTPATTSQRVPRLRIDPLPSILSVSEMHEHAIASEIGQVTPDEEGDDQPHPIVLSPPRGAATEFARQTFGQYSLTVPTARYEASSDGGGASSSAGRRLTSEFEIPILPDIPPNAYLKPSSTALDRQTSGSGSQMSGDSDTKGHNKEGETAAEKSRGKKRQFRPRSGSISSDLESRVGNKRVITIAGLSRLLKAPSSFTLSQVGSDDSGRLHEAVEFSFNATEYEAYL